MDSSEDGAGKWIEEIVVELMETRAGESMENEYGRSG